MLPLRARGGALLLGSDWLPPGGVALEQRLVEFPAAASDAAWRQWLFSRICVGNSPLRFQFEHGGVLSAWLIGSRENPKEQKRR